MKIAGWKVVLLANLLVGGSGCQQQEVEGIKLNNLTEQQDYTQLISRSLHHDSQALAELVAFDCGGAAGCYDLGDVITQIVCQVGEPEFVKMTAHFSPQQQRDVRSFLEVGLEYGSHATQKRPDNSVCEQFPILDRQLIK